MITYTTIAHQPSGEIYAAEINELGEILRAAGPLHHSDPIDADSLRDCIDNQDQDNEYGNAGR